MTSRRLRAFALACTALALAACDDGPVSRVTKHVTDAELARAALAGYPARIVLEGAPGGDAAQRRDETLLVLGARSVHVVPAQAFTPFTESGFEAWLWRVWLSPYVAVSDLDGAFRAAARGYTRALQDQRLLPRGAPLAPVPSPNEWAFAFPSHNTDWGIPMAAAVFALCLVVERISRRGAPRRKAGSISL